MAGDPDFGRESVVSRVNQGTETSHAPGPPADPSRPAPPESRKYSVEATVGAGGMGEVLLVTDRDLRRQVAMKVIRRDLAALQEYRVKFIGEAQATSQLEHPGIPPVHDLGIAADGTIYFTMKLVRGQTLREVLKALLLDMREARREYTLHRLVTVLERVAEAVHFAHEKGVIHRDLKPDNIMLGSYGEVHVMDWGLARLLDAPEDDSSGERRVDIETAGGALDTKDGVIKGTVAYMSPEQAGGRPGELGRPTDIYALGCILYEILTLHIAFEGRGQELLDRVRKGEVPPVEKRNPRRPVPEALAELCRKAMGRETAVRPPTARAFAEGLRSWLDGTSDRDRRHRSAERLARMGKEAVAEFRALESAQKEAESRVDAESRRFRPHQPVAEKAPLLDARRELAALRRRKILSFAEASRLLDAALLEEEGNETARRSLAGLWHGRLEEAERAGAADDAAFALAMIRRYDDGRLAAAVKGDGSLHLRTTPTGVQVTLEPLEDRNGILVPGEPRILGRTPLEAIPLPMGSYLCRLRLAGHHEARYPVWISRNRAWGGEVRMHPAAAFGDEWVLVPGGPFLYGSGKEAREVEVPDFLLQRRPVTFGDYAEFLSALDRAAGAEAAGRHLPAMDEGFFMERLPDGTYRVLPGIVEGKARERCLRDHGEGFPALLPVLGVSWVDATAYCGWKSSVTGRRWRLPTEEEREKAGRGVDGRPFPWGGLEDASLAKCRDSREEAAQPEPAGGFPEATSIYGVVDAAGGAWEWTDSWIDGRRQARVLRGGSWRSELSNLRCSFRLSFDPATRTTATGFRCARDLD